MSLVAKKVVARQKKATTATTAAQKKKEKAEGKEKMAKEKVGQAARSKVKPKMKRSDAGNNKKSTGTITSRGRANTFPETPPKIDLMGLFFANQVNFLGTFFCGRSIFWGLFFA